jgi:hypothetical protein
MKRDFKTWMLLLIFGLPVFLLVFIASLYFVNCGFNNDCSQAGLAPILHTPIPTLISATLPVPQLGSQEVGTVKCTVTAEKLLAAWVSNGYPEKDAYKFTDSKGAACQATFTDVQPLFTEANLWYAGALACASCHNADLKTAAAQMDLSSYAGMQAGSRRTTAVAKGNDIFGGGIWEQSKLYDMLFVKKLMPFGRPAGAVADEGPTILAGTPVVSASSGGQ